MELRLWHLLKPVLILLFTGSTVSGQINISKPSSDQSITIGNSKLSITLDYNHKCAVTKLAVNGEIVVSGRAGIFSEIRTAAGAFSTQKLAASPRIETTKNRVTLSGVCYGENEISVCETWIFRVTETDIKLDIERTVARPFLAEEVSFPAVYFNRIGTWDGAFTGYGGLAWFYLFNEKLCTYGVHSGYSAFWNSKSGNGLKISAFSPDRQVASKFTRSAGDELVYSVSISDDEMKYRYDADTKRRRFIRGKTDVWEPFTVSAGKQVESITFSWLNYRDEYDRGHLAGINGNQVTSVLNTIARIGVIDAKHFGGNSWHTPYGPICLHEQYIAQMGMAINDPNYLEGYRQCLDFYRDKAIQPDGRVLSRWAYDNSDAMPGTATDEGFYEAQWGYLFDSNPDFVINVSELYNQSGDLKWVEKQKAACEKALEYLLNRDANGNHLVEMMTDDHSEKKGSDWIDIIWASYENAFVNAEMYYALTLWSAIEKQLGDPAKAVYYANWASELKTSFNKSTRDGGFWDEKNRWYVHWLDQDKTVHGNNLVIPVNFMAIAYGICEDNLKRKAILDRIEDQMQKENLFAWPLCLFTYEKGEGKDGQFPFPNYENGDIFLSWGALGVQAYAAYNPELALKYVENILARYEKDGLAFQRYGRVLQDGTGDDILAGNGLAIVGLYTSIYGINPMYNRMYLNPNLPEKLSGTELNYDFRGDKLKIRLDKYRYSISNKQFTLTATGRFGYHAEKNSLEFFSDDRDICSLKAQPSMNGNLSIEIITWKDDVFRWSQAITGKKVRIAYSVYSLKPDQQYSISINGQIIKNQVSSKEGTLEFSINAGTQASEVHLQMR